MNSPLMPKSTAVWLIENTSLTFEQISKFYKMHLLEIQGIADGEVARGMVAYNPIMSGQLTREEIELSTSDKARPLMLKRNEIEIETHIIKNSDHHIPKQASSIALNYILKKF